MRRGDPGLEILQKSVLGVRSCAKSRKRFCGVSHGSLPVLSTAPRCRFARKNPGRVFARRLKTARKKVEQTNSREWIDGAYSPRERKGHETYDWLTGRRSGSRASFDSVL